MPTPVEAARLNLQVQVAGFDPELSTAPVDVESVSALWDLSVSFFAMREGICAFLGGRANLFSVESMECFSRKLHLTAQHLVDSNGLGLCAIVD